MSKVSSYTKFIVSLAGALLTTVLVVDWGFDLPPWVAGVSALVTALGVFLAKNTPYVAYGTTLAEREAQEEEDQAWTDNIPHANHLNAPRDQ